MSGPNNVPEIGLVRDPRFGPGIDPVPIKKM